MFLGKKFLYIFFKNQILFCKWLNARFHIMSSLEGPAIKLSPVSTVKSPAVIILITRTCDCSTECQLIIIIIIFLQNFNLFLGKKEK